MENPRYTFQRVFIVDSIYSTTIDIITNNILFFIFKLCVNSGRRLTVPICRYRSIRAAGCRSHFTGSVLAGPPAHGTMLQKIYSRTPDGGSQRIKSDRRHLERTYIASHSIFDLKLLRSATNRYHKFIVAAKKLFYAALIQSFTFKPRALWKTINNNTQNWKSLPTHIIPSGCPITAICHIIL